MTGDREGVEGGDRERKKNNKFRGGEKEGREREKERKKNYGRG